MAPATRPTRPSRPTRLTKASLVALARQSGDLSRAAVADIESRHPWYGRLSAKDRASVALVASAGVDNFIGWLGEGGDAAEAAVHVFDQAPRELTRSISLAQTLDLIRSVVDVIEHDAGGLVGEAQAQALRFGVLSYSREVAFGAAHVYAAAAELRGAWDARLEALVVDALLRGEADDAIQSRAAALGWGAATRVAVVAASPRNSLDDNIIDPAKILDRLHRTAIRNGLHLLAAVQGGRVICILGETDDALADARLLAPEFGDGPIVVGPTVPHLFAAGRSARAAIAGHAAAHAWPGAPRPASSDDLLAERALLGDIPARNGLVSRIVDVLRKHPGGVLLDTATTFLETGRVLEETARTLYVHPNTVRYRLGRIADLTGYDLGDPHDAHIAHLAIQYARLAAAGMSGTASVAPR